MDGEDLARAIGGHADHAAAGYALHLALTQLFLRARHILLHLLRLLHQLLHVESHLIASFCRPAAGYLVRIAFLFPPLSAPDAIRCRKAAPLRLPRRRFRTGAPALVLVLVPALAALLPQQPARPPLPHPDRRRALHR